MKKLIPFFFVLLLITNCKKITEENGSTLNIQIQPFFGNDSLQLNTEYKTIDGRKIKFTECKFYLSEIRLITNNDSFKIEDIFLFSNTHKFITKTYPSVTFNKINFSFGLNSYVNNLNPNVFANEHPLSTTQGTYWSMLKYRFLILEGLIDSSENKNGVLNYPFTYHLGTDTLYRNLSFNSIIQGNQTTTIKVDLQKMFYNNTDTIDIKYNVSNHSSTTQIPLAIKMISNLMNGISVE